MASTVKPIELQHPDYGVLHVLGISQGVPTFYADALLAQKAAPAGTVYTRGSLRVQVTDEVAAGLSVFVPPNRLDQRAKYKQVDVPFELTILGA